MFARLLAGRYIRAQKRHSILTVCSIAIAIALMAMLFTSFSTFVGCMRSVAMDDSPYHLVIPDITKEEGIAISKAVGEDGSCKVRQTGQGSYTALIYFERYIDDREVYIEKMLTAAKLPPLTTYYELNTALMLLDMTDLRSRFTMVQYFAMFYVFVIFLAIALRLVIDTAFEVSSKERERQFGVLQSIGAAPGQIVQIITYEGLLLSVMGIPIGLAAGIGLAYTAYKAIIGSGLSEAYFTPEKAAELLHFHVSPLMLLIAALTGLVWVLLSAYGTGVRIIRMSPMQAISARSNTVKKVRKHSVLGLLFGWKGKLAARNNSRQPKRFLITIVSLTISITLFAAFSVVMEQVEEFARKESELNLGTMDFELNVKKDAFDPLSYREALQTARECGYFTDIDFNTGGGIALYHAGGEDQRLVLVLYYAEESYDRLFDGNPPVSYETLSSQDGLLLLTDKEHAAAPENFRGMSSIPTEIRKSTHYTPEEYVALPKEQQELAEEYTFYNGVSGETSIRYYKLTEEYMHDYTIYDTAEVLGLYWDESWGVDAEISDKHIYLAGTLEQYEANAVGLYGNAGSWYQIPCNLADGVEYREAMEFISMQNCFSSCNDNYGYRQKQKAKFAAVRIGITFINLMIALIAIVNMVNILSTGILNRRNEIAAMQCVGMTERQLYGMTIVECMQYALGAGIAALLLSEGLMFATEQFMRATELIEELGKHITYTAPLPRIGIAVVLAFVAALLASMIPLRGMQKSPLVEQLRNVD